VEQNTHRRYRVIDNRYRVLEPLGSGGMASVYLAYDQVLGRRVAVKVLNPRLEDDREFVERFRREARIAAAFTHPNIASVHDLGEPENSGPYIAMEYVPAGTLRDQIRKKGCIPPSTAGKITLQIAQALQAAHACGTIHRDIKPQNILLTETGEVKVVDFGIARAAAFSSITQTGHVLGTACYMSPEQAEGGPVGPQSDLYSLGVVLYEMLTGKLPYKADTASSLEAESTRGRLLTPPKVVNPAVPAKLSAITARLLAQDPSQRYLDASSLIDGLERVIGESAEDEGSIRSITLQVVDSILRHTRAAYKSNPPTRTKPYTPEAPPVAPGGYRRKPIEIKRFSKALEQYLDAFYSVEEPERAKEKRATNGAPFGSAAARHIRRASQRVWSAYKSKIPAKIEQSPPPLPILLRDGRGKLARKKRPKVLPRVMLAGLILVAALALTDPAGLDSLLRLPKDLEGGNGTTSTPMAPPTTSRPTPPNSPTELQPFPQSPPSSSGSFDSPNGSEAPFFSDPQVSPSQGPDNWPQDSLEEIENRIIEELQRVSSRG
jgi:serine/threonine protein kinase